MSQAIEICRGFTDDQWRKLRPRLEQNGRILDDEGAWSCAVDVFERRIRERFLSSIEALMDADSRSPRVEIPPEAPPGSTLPKDDGKQIVVPGFAIMALCCLLIDTLQSFREARAGASTPNVFKKFLELPAFHAEFDEETAKQFVRGIRDRILHDAETREWIILREEPRDRIVERRGKRYALNRTEFYGALRTEFENYVQELREPSNRERRQRFLSKMDDIAKKC